MRPRVQVINNEARNRNRQLTAGPEMPAIKAWLIKRVMPWVLWMMGAKMFNSDFRMAYKIPGYRIIPAVAEHTEKETHTKQSSVVPEHFPAVTQGRVG